MKWLVSPNNTFCLDCANIETHINYMEDEYGAPLGRCPECKKLETWARQTVEGWQYE